MPDFICPHKLALALETANTKIHNPLYAVSVDEVVTFELEQLPTILAAASAFQAVQALLHSYSGVDGTAHPWWAICKNASSFGKKIILAGPFLSREECDDMLEARRYEWGATAHSYCFSAHHSAGYKKLFDTTRPGQTYYGHGDNDTPVDLRDIFKPQPKGSHNGDTTQAQ